MTFNLVKIKIASIYINSSKIHKKLSKRNISAEKRILYCKLSQFQKIREITAGHLYLGLGQSPQSFLVFGLELELVSWTLSLVGALKFMRKLCILCKFEMKKIFTYLSNAGMYLEIIDVR